MTIENKYRTHDCGELRPEHVGTKARLSGWVDTVRDHGGVIFVDLRDHYGVTQVVFREDSPQPDFSRESTICVHGEIMRRDDETKNPNMATGEVELRCTGYEVLGGCDELPFMIRESEKTREDLRLKYRFLDLRNPDIHKNIVLRSQVTSHMRTKMCDMGFLEITTPILTSSSPEGARDYLVPSRKHPGKFYALPQAPQQFKQLLMTSGFDKYFQIAPCFRDEDARADRSPGEFYQLDFEMAFATQEDVFSVAEEVMYDVFTTFSDKKVSDKPFPRITYADSLLKYGCDKPDLRNPLIIEDLTGFFAEVDFPLFKGKPVRGILAPDCADKPRSFFDKMLDYAMSIGMKGLGYIQVLEGMELKGPIVKFLSDEQIDYLAKTLSWKANDVLFFISDSPKLVDGYAGDIRTELGQRLELIEQDAFRFCFIVDYPMYEIGEQSGRIEFTHNPFSMPQGELEALETKDPLDILAYQYDIVCNGVELSSGAVRNHRPDVMERAFEIAGYTREELESRFSALYNAFHYGAPPHAGMAPGLDRIVMLLADAESIREVTAFPMNSNAQDLLCGAPGEVSELQLREANIKLRKLSNQ